MNVLLVDDHTLVRRGLAHVVGECFPEADIHEAGDADEAIGILNGQAMDLALLDVRLPGKDGIGLLKDVKAKWPDLPVIMLTSFDEAKFARSALSEGAAGYILKDSSPADLDQAIRVALAGGGNVLSTGVIQNMFEEMDSAAETRSPEVLAESMSKRETQILGFLVDGASNREIATALDLSEKTIKAHLAAIYRKLNVGNRTQAAMIAMSIGISPSSEASDSPETPPTSAPAS
jgi:DNA-binding NarL/FixJ family response regulator